MASIGSKVPIGAMSYWVRYSRAARESSWLDNSIEAPVVLAVSSSTTKSAWRSSRRAL